MKQKTARMRGAPFLVVTGAWLAALLAAAPVTYAASYTKILSNTYHAQSKNYYCGPASIQMMLDSATVGNVKVAQDTLYAKVQTYNTDSAHWYTDPNGLKGTVQFYDPSRTYLTFYHDSLSSANRKLAYNLDRHNVPASALFYGGAHWVDVRGVWTINFAWQGSARPRDDGTYTINGFFVRDPWDKWNGLGRDRFLWNLPGGWRSYFKKVTGASAPGSPWINKYTTVADPDPIVDFDTTMAPSPPRTEMLTAAEAAALAWTTLNMEDDEGSRPLLAQYGFSIPDGYFSEFEAFNLWWHEDGRIDWIVPFVDPSILGPDNITGAVILDAWTGDAYQATWIDVNDPANSPMELHALFQFEYAGGIYNTNLIPEPSSFSLLTVVAIVWLISRRYRNGGNKKVRTGVVLGESTAAAPPRLTATNRHGY